MTKTADLMSNVILKTEMLAMPNAVVEAMNIDFGLPVTAYLCNVVLEGQVAMGNVFVDRFRRFNHGNGIHTSKILSKPVVKGTCSWRRSIVFTSYALGQVTDLGLGFRALCIETPSG